MSELFDDRCGYTWPEDNEVGVISHIRTRLRDYLLQAGLVEHYDEDRGIYVISEHGRAYLEGNLTADDLESAEK